ncbi:MAG: hypothetical protein ABSH44_14055 [Bryobacteraceae bacterium]
MAKISLNKSIEARKLNLRTGLPMTGPELTIPFGAIIEHAGTDRGTAKFRYLGELYSCRHEVLVDALDANALGPEAPAAPVEQTAPAAPVRSKAKLQWEPLDSSDYSLLRAKVPGGWLVALAGAGVTFYPDPEHQWDGSSVA